MQKPTIAIDLDDVLTPHIAEFITFVNRTYPEKGHITLADFRSDSWLLFGGTDEDDVKLVHEFYKTDEYANAPTMPGARDVLEKLQEEYRLVIVTSRPKHLEEISKQWVENHFPNIFSDIILGNIWALDGVSISKPDMCKRVGATILIDDSIRYALQCAQEGISVLLFGNYPWNQQKNLPANIIRVVGWNEVELGLRMLKS